MMKNNENTHMNTMAFALTIGILLIKAIFVFFLRGESYEKKPTDT